MDVVIYSKSNCPFCEKAKAWFKQHGFTFTENRLDDEEQRLEFYQKVPGARSVPQIFIDDKLIGTYNVKATFFVLGDVAKKFPSIIRLIHNQGHEIGVHGYHHIQFFRMKPKDAIESLTRTKKIIEDITGCTTIPSNPSACYIKLSDGGLCLKTCVMWSQATHQG